MPTTPTYSLAPYKNALKRDDLLHLLRRCFFGVSHKDLVAFEGKDINQAMNILLKQSPPAPIPVQVDPDRIDPLVPRGQTWTRAPYEDEFIDKSRRYALRSWITGQMINRDRSLTEKMTLFWHNLLVIEQDVVKDSRYSYTYAAMVRAHALGNFKKLITEATTNLAMLVYLSGNTSSKGTPNENYARELMELFTLGKETYTEGDVKEVARVLTGWRDDKEAIEVKFIPSLHDDGDKQFSALFGNAVIKGKRGLEGAQEIEELIEMIFKREELSTFFCRKLYRWFVFHEIDERVESQVITPLAKVFRDNNFEVVPVLKVLLSSEHFFDPSFKGCMTKNPVDFFVGTTVQLDLVFPEELAKNYLTWSYIYLWMEGMGMGIGDPPSVAGWPAYYQPPKYGQWWINSYTLGIRRMIINGLSLPEGMMVNGPVLKFDFVPFVQKLKKFDNLDGLVDNCLEFLFAVNVNQNSKNKLKAILLQKVGSEDKWMQLWNKLVNNGDNEAKQEIDMSLRPFFKMVLNMPESNMM